MHHGAGADYSAVDDAGDSPPPLYDVEAERSARAHIIEPKRTYPVAFVLDVAAVAAVVLLAADVGTFWLAIVVYAVYLIEALCCPASPMRYLAGEPQSAPQAIHRIQELQNTPPVIEMAVRCYHYETRHRTVTTTDSEGRQHTHTESYDVRVDTHSATESFAYSYCTHDDGFLSSVDAALPFDTVRLQLNERITFGDAWTENAFNDRVARFRSEHAGRDTHMDYTQRMYTPGFRRHFIMSYHEHVPWYMTPLACVAASVLLLSWPYRLFVQSQTVKVVVDLRKAVFVKPK
ncbi:TMEM151 family [Plasmodiophora brassicae]